MQKQAKSLKHYVYLTWAVPAALAVVAIAIVFFTFSWLDHRHAIERVQDELTEQSNTISRRIAAELLIGSNGAPSVVAGTLQKTYDLQSVQLLNSSPDCLTPDKVTCSTVENGTFILYRKIEHVPGLAILEIKKQAPLLFQSLDMKLLGWSIFPVLFVLGLGLFLQRYYLRRYVERPIELLVDMAVMEKSPRPHWPKEFLEISNRLSDSFQQRDQVVFGQIASGVIHDIKTHLHSVLSATALVSESIDDQAKKASRLELLYKACKTNLPKMKKIIEHTLDGSREIAIKKEHRSMTSAIQNAALVNKELAVARNVRLEFYLPNEFFVPHDQIQMERVFTNLIKNAIEAFDDQLPEEAQLKERVLRISGESSSGSATVIIEDSGPGLERPDRLFRPLKSSKTHGSGLGLFISKKIVEAHQGTIVADKSKNLGGASFQIKINNDEVQV